jgi:hypothetical protein
MSGDKFCPDIGDLRPDDSIPRLKKRAPSVIALSKIPGGRILLLVQLMLEGDLTER